MARNKFKFKGAYFTAASNDFSNDFLNINIYAYFNEVLQYQQTAIVNADKPTWFEFGYMGWIDRLQFE